MKTAVISRESRMVNGRTPQDRRRAGLFAPRRQSGYALLIILFMLAVLTILVVRAAPSVVQQIRRQREEELIHRGQQYVRAIRHFYKKFGRYPARLEELKETNHIRFLRKMYKDPMTPSGEWRLIHQGEPIQLTGLFGKPLAQPGSNPQPTTGFGSTINPFTAGGINPQNNQAGQNTSATGMAPGSSVGARGGNSGTGASVGLVLGGGPIIGVASTSTAQSIIELNGKNHYNDWQFVYDPRMELPLTPAVNPVQQPGNRNPSTGGMNPNGMVQPR